MPDDLSSSRGRGSAKKGSGSSYSSSIEERRSNGQYFKFPKNKKKRTIKKEEIQAKVVSTCTEDDDEDNDSDTETFWGKWRKDRVENKE